MSPARAVRMAARPAPRRIDRESAPDLRLVAGGAASRRRRALTRTATVLASALAAVGLFGVVALHVLLTQGQAELDQLSARAEAEADRNSRLTVEVAQLEAPARIVEAARGRLGMVPVTAIVYLPGTDPASPLPPVPTEPLPAPSTTGIVARP